MTASYYNRIPSAMNCLKSPVYFIGFLIASSSLTSTAAFPVTSHRRNDPSSYQSTSALGERAAFRNKANYEAMLGVTDNAKERFQGKTVLLTGASGGLGKEIAFQLAECKAKQIILSGRNHEALELVAKSCREIFPSTQAHVVTCDLSNKSSVQELGDQALELCNDIDILINNGGVSSRSNFVDTSLEVDEKVMQINFFAGAALAKKVLPGMVERKSGAIIWISSIQGLIGIPSRTSYAASKFSVQGYCESLRAEVASSGVGVHVVSPGYIRTNLSRSALTGNGTEHGTMDETTANGRPPKEVAITLLNAIAKGKTDIIVAATLSAKIAIWLKFLAPSLLQNILEKRYEKSTKIDKQKMTDDREQRTKID